jgi:hypothetical protein
VVAHREREESGVRPFFNPAMLSMVGVAAVGLVGGETFLLDLGLDDAKILPGGTRPCDPPVLFEKPHRFCVVDPDEPNAAEKRLDTVNKRALLALDVSDQRGNSF